MVDFFDPGEIRLSSALDVAKMNVNQERTLTRSTLVKAPLSKPSCSSKIDASYRSGYVLATLCLPGFSKTFQRDNQMEGRSPTRTPNNSETHIASEPGSQGEYEASLVG